MGKQGKKIVKSVVSQEYIYKLKILANELDTIPKQTDFTKRKLGTVATVQKYFGNWKNFVEEANLEFDPVRTYPIDADMEKLYSIMQKFDLDPKTPEFGYGSPIDKMLFTQILLEKYPDLAGTTKKERYIDNNKTRLLNFIGVKARQSIYRYTREHALDAIKGYKDYYPKYLMCKAGFLDDPRYLELQELEEEKIRVKDRMKFLVESIIA